MLSRGFETEISASAKGTALRRVGSPYLSCDKKKQNYSMGEEGKTSSGLRQFHGLNCLHEDLSLNA